MKGEKRRWQGGVPEPSRIICRGRLLLRVFGLPFHACRVLVLAHLGLAPTRVRRYCSASIYEYCIFALLASWLRPSLSSPLVETIPKKSIFPATNVGDAYTSLLYFN